MQFKQLALTVALAALPLAGEVSLPALVSDHMVLQRDEPLRIWGKASPGEAVTVTFLGAVRSATAGDTGRWELFLPPAAAGGPHEMRIQGTNSITLRDIYIGEVWLASGQSNMEWRLRHSDQPEREIAAAQFPLIRLFHVPHRMVETPQEDVEAKWQPCSPATVPDFSAVAYYFGRDLHQRLNVPVGLIESARGGTPAEAWVSGSALRKHPELHYYLNKWTRLIAEYPAEKAKYDAAMKKWEANGKIEANRPRTPLGPGNSSMPSVLFNGMIAPLVPYTIRGFLWYQGETNATRSEGDLYRTLFPALIADWRERWGLGTLPFLYVQLANYGGVGTGPGTEWPEVREAQRETLAVSRTAMVVANDVGDTVNIHPKNKRAVGDRLALAARRIVYGEKIVPSGPMYRRATFENGSVRLWFDWAENGLRARFTQPLEGFVVAGADRVFHPAQARIEGRNIVVSSAAVPKPEAVRYAWSPEAHASFTNADGLPASPFRTDVWDRAAMPAPLPLPTFGKDGWKSEAKPVKPNVLIIGDSISIGYTRQVRYLLRDAANVLRPVQDNADLPVNCQSTLTGIEKLESWLGNTKWDAIHFNWGLHDLCYRHPDSKDPGKRDKAKGKISVPLDQYEKNLESLVVRLEKTGACLAFANTTFVPADEIGRFQGDEKKYNAVAARVMERHGIPVTDLYTSTSRFEPSMFLGPGNVHFGAEANWALGQQVADAVRNSLARCAERKASR